MTLNIYIGPSKKHVNAREKQVNNLSEQVYTWYENLLSSNSNEVNSTLRNKCLYLFSYLDNIPDMNIKRIINKAYSC